MCCQLPMAIWMGASSYYNNITQLYGNNVPNQMHCVVKLYTIMHDDNHVTCEDTTVAQ